MKLFGSKRKPQRTGGADKTKSAHSKKLHLTGKQRGLLILLGSVLVLAGVIFGVYKIMVKPPPVTKPATSSTPGGSNQVSTFDEETGEEIVLDVDVPGSHKNGYYNILLLGTDDDGTRTDTIMIARMDTSDHTVALMSVPRDTLVSVNYSVPKINSVYGMNGKEEKGIAALRKQLTAILGFDVDGYVLVNLEAFIKVVDLVGGVPFEVPQNMFYNDPTQDLYINLQKGLQTLGGQEAMQLVRYRKYAEADIQRTKVQQDFMKATAKQCLKIGNLSKLKSLAEIFMEYVKTDLSLGNMLYFGQELLKCDFDAMETYTLPGQGGVKIQGGGDYYALFPSQVLEIVNESFNPYDTPIPLGNLHIRTASSGGGSGGGKKPAPSATKPTTPAVTPVPEQPVETPTEPLEPTDPTAPPEQTPENPVTPENPAPPAEPGTGSNGADILDPGTATTPETPPVTPVTPPTPPTNPTAPAENPPATS